jgi:hypothetical protein
MEQQQRPFWWRFMIRGGRLRSRRLYSLFNPVAVMQRENIDEKVMSTAFHEHYYTGKGYINLVPCHEQLPCRGVVVLVELQVAKVRNVVEWHKHF